MENTIVDPETLKVRAILDWEYAGFYPEYFERKFYERQGPSIALEGEEDDSQKLLSYLQAHQVCHPRLSPPRVLLADLRSRPHDMIYGICILRAYTALYY